MRTVAELILVICLLVGLLALPAAATVWTVEKVGSGDFTIIQDALDAAASGDTVSIGPGRFDDVHIFEFPDGVTDAHCLARQDEMTIIGVGPDSTIIGPEQGPGGQFEPDGVITDVNTILTLVGLAVQNCADGVEINGLHGYVSDYRSRANYRGILGFPRGGGLEVRDSEFLEIQERGIQVVDVLGAHGILIEDCIFRGGTLGISLHSDDNLVRGCTFDGQFVGLQFSFGATGSVESCRFENLGSTGVVLSTGSQIHLVDSHLGVSQANIDVSNGSILTGSGNILLGGTFASIRIIADTTIDFQGNHIFNAGGWSAYVVTPSLTQVSFDLTNNYWGTAEAEQISTWIRDKEDGATKTTVLFEPFSAIPLPTEQRSISSLKARFD